MPQSTPLKNIYLNLSEILWKILLITKWQVSPSGLIIWFNLWQSSFWLPLNRTVSGPATYWYRTDIAISALSFVFSVISVATVPACRRVMSSSASMASQSPQPVTWVPPSSGMKRCGLWWGGATRMSSSPLFPRKSSLDLLTKTLNVTRAGSTRFSRHHEHFEEHGSSQFCLCLRTSVVVFDSWPCIPPSTSRHLEGSDILTLGPEALTCHHTSDKLVSSSCHQCCFFTKPLSGGCGG